jgi:hypothetical protein
MQHPANDRSWPELASYLGVTSVCYRESCGLNSMNQRRFATLNENICIGGVTSPKIHWNEVFASNMVKIFVCPIIELLVAILAGHGLTKSIIELLK